MKSVPSLLALVMFIIIGCSKSDDDLDTFKQILGDAVLLSTLQERRREGDVLFYTPNSENPYTGWFKEVGKNGQVRTLAHCQDGKMDGLKTTWHENGQKREETPYKGGREIEVPYKYGKSEVWWYDNGLEEAEVRLSDPFQLPYKLYKHYKQWFTGDTQAVYDGFDDKTKARYQPLVDVFNGNPNDLVTGMTLAPFFSDYYGVPDDEVRSNRMAYAQDLANRPGVEADNTSLYQALSSKFQERTAWLDTKKAAR